MAATSFFLTAFSSNSSTITFWHCGSHASKVVKLLSYWTLHSHGTIQCTARVITPSLELLHSYLIPQLRYVKKNYKFFQRRYCIRTFLWIKDDWTFIFGALLKAREYHNKNPDDNKFLKRASANETHKINRPLMMSLSVLNASERVRIASEVYLYLLKISRYQYIKVTSWFLRRLHWIPTDAFATSRWINHHNKNKTHFCVFEGNYFILI